MHSEPVRIALVQMSCTADLESNFRKASSSVRKAAAGGAKIVCLQELFGSLYFCQTEEYSPFQLAVPVPGPETERLQELAGELGVVLIASVFEKRARGLYHNTALVIDADGRYLGKYRKMHIPDDPGFYEKFYFTPGDLGYRVFETRYATIGVLICWDQWYPEAARLTALKGAEILFYPTAIGWAVSESSPGVRAAQRDAWITVQRSHAVTNGVFVAAPNRVGVEGELRFWGSSFVCSPFGEMLVEGGERDDDVLYADCDLSEIAYYRSHWPFLRDRRVETYGDLQHRYLDS
ncbi:carbon-nitrogen hydrolase [Prosthecochloris sp. N3]|uniref:Carbon-nitrogen hydrolase n=1 Tax=Prosthecochloris ethylica TaxID=2743976 RepID=A0ABR9XT36_9CHLB|nr:MULTISPECIES: carbon-nitrogen hydrolase [Prosthecochloris]MEC9486102.1 carbon-nitrogen hydrolase [Prosthecochloris sp.]MBF0585613.1 carbon-nitrogen hydrolase [Prosthecochloris ethylica]MBF0637094.1 carbon-nitrogen hydrolase [Prosthecochloris ethylica]NUK46843.1 carbon-nitrogen hydrolase [Prosthecochloris ethylica]RNA64584.1 acyltransferase [Prosthecochloris sp. ZM_2]